jgi:hypothetical protein
MRRLLFLLVSAALLFALSIPLAAQIPHPTVIDNGNICGGAGPRNYYYDVSVWATELFTSFGIGVHNPVLANYANILVPVGWQVAIKELNPELPPWTMPDDPYTAHGIVSGGPTGLCPYTLFWNSMAPGSAVQSFGFGFDYNAEPHDVGWVVSGIRENWGQPVGAGAGPVHSPVPEPGSLLVLCSGLVTLAGATLRKRL